VTAPGRSIPTRLNRVIRVAYNQEWIVTAIDDTNLDAVVNTLSNRIDPGA
jgi:hypothetical protein